ncbi:uncharacterized protein si:dkeyp-57d7.4 [Danio rerio]|uniref:Proline-rich protein 18-like n=1 Tax=Danio rerio TaxID=7955 RepID=A0A8M2BI80_DANRE|nr:proline-rich protein 18-like [Danio rerio]XP_021331575.1 proline-rich protein 18-like [Danio rerio]|eukprot:XP_005170943.1 proline-rich protein 18-like [Danio rerio]
MFGTLKTNSCLDHAKDHIPFLPHCTSKTEFLSYLFLYISKMPFPPVTRPRSLPNSSKEKLPGPSPVILVTTTEEKSSVKERLKKLSKKATPHKSKLPTSRATSGLRMEGRNTWVLPSRPAGPTSSSKSTSGIPISTTNTSSKKRLPISVSATSIPMEPSSPPASSGSSHGLNSESNFSLNLTPEATLLLQRRNREKQLRASRNNSTSLQPKDRLAAKTSFRSNIPLVKISLLNERHRYDDVEYEEDEEQGVDQSILLKCSEWLRGVENAAGATVLGRVDKISQKSI